MSFAPKFYFKEFIQIAMNVSTKTFAESSALQYC